MTSCKSQCYSSSFDGFVSILNTLTRSPSQVTQEKRLEAKKTNSDVDLVVGDDEEEGKKIIEDKIEVVRTENGETRDRRIIAKLITQQGLRLQIITIGKGHHFKTLINWP